MSNNPYGNPYVLRLLSRTMAIITITTEAMAMKRLWNTRLLQQSL